MTTQPSQKANGSIWTKGFAVLTGLGLMAQLYILFGL